jgi:hypothetical protein
MLNILVEIIREDGRALRSLARSMGRASHFILATTAF